MKLKKERKTYLIYVCIKKNFFFGSFLVKHGRFFVPLSKKIQDSKKRQSKQKEKKKRKTKKDGFEEQLYLIFEIELDYPITKTDNIESDIR